MEHNTSDSANEELRSYADKILGVCRNLADRVAGFPDSSLARLAREVVLALKTEGNVLAQILITALCSGHLELDGLLLDSANLRNRFYSTQAQVLQASDILDFCSQCMARGEDKALDEAVDGKFDAIFASTFVLYKWPADADEDYPLHLQIKDDRLLHSLLNQLVPSNGVWDEAHMYVVSSCPPLP